MKENVFEIKIYNNYFMEIEFENSLIWWYLMIVLKKVENEFLIN